MLEQSLVTIIIPTFNRADLIGETLDSVLAQTYENWECLVVDDGSMDGTAKVIQGYCAKDSRFQYHKRPDTHMSGGNGARNYGFEISKGDYIQWFDSDDLMMPEKIAIKVQTIEKYKVDFVISKTKYFNRDNKDNYPYDYKEKEVSFLAYSTTDISWFTPDMFVKRTYAEIVKFNEHIKAGQEYNFSCKLLLETHNIKKIDRFLTLRRFHKESIGRMRQLNRGHYWETNFNLHWTTWNELKINHKLPIQYERYALLKCSKSQLMNTAIKVPSGFLKSLFGVFGARAFYFYLAKLTNMVSGKYHYFYSKFKKA